MSVQWVYEFTVSSYTVSPKKTLSWTGVKPTLITNRILRRRTERFQILEQNL